MAKNYTFAEVCAIINEGTNIEAITDIGRRYPVLLYKVSQVTAVAGDKFVDLMSFMPDYLTANKVNSSMKSTGSTESDSDSGEDIEDKATEAGKSEKNAGGESDYDSMSGKELYEIAKKRGLLKTAKSNRKAD